MFVFVYKKVLKVSNDFFKSHYKCEFSSSALQMRKSGGNIIITCKLQFHSYLRGNLKVQTFEYRHFAKLPDDMPNAMKIVQNIKWRPETTIKTGRHRKAKRVGFFKI